MRATSVRMRTALVGLALLAAGTCWGANVALPMPWGDVQALAPDQQAHVWTENSLMRWAVFTHVNGTKMKKRATAISLTPGEYTLSVYTSRTDDMYLAGIQTSGKFDVQLLLEPGHTYVVRQDQAEGRIRPYVEDVGIGKECEYITGIRDRVITIECRDIAG